MSDRKKATYAETPEPPEALEPTADEDTEATEDGAQEEDPPEVGTEDQARGYSIGSWNGHPNFIALDGSMSTLDEQQIKAHVRRRGLTRE